MCVCVCVGGGNKEIKTRADEAVLQNIAQALLGSSGSREEKPNILLCASSNPEYFFCVYPLLFLCLLGFALAFLAPLFFIPDVPIPSTVRLFQGLVVVPGKANRRRVEAVFHVILFSHLHSGLRSQKLVLQLGVFGSFVEPVHRKRRREIKRSREQKEYVLYQYCAFCSFGSISSVPMEYAFNTCSTDSA